jgi:Cu/Ag efflux pump CusA
MLSLPAICSGDHPIVFAISIITVVFLTLFALEGIEGKMFAPLAYAIIFALLGSMFVSILIVPVFSSYFMKRGKGKENPVIRTLKKIYLPILKFALDQRAVVIILVVIGFVLAGYLFTIIGTEFMPTGSVRDSFIIFTGTVFACFGGLVAIWMREIPFTISSGVGFVVASGVSVLNGLIMVSTIKENLAEGMPLSKAIEEGVLLRLRPIFMAGLVAILGFLPMALSAGRIRSVRRLSKITPPTTTVARGR